MGQFLFQWPFSIAMLNYQRVRRCFGWKSSNFCRASKGDSGAFRTGPVGCTRAEVKIVLQLHRATQIRKHVYRRIVILYHYVCLHKWVHTQPLYIAVEVSIWSQVVKCVLRFFKATDEKGSEWSNTKNRWFTIYQRFGKDTMRKEGSNRITTYHPPFCLYSCLGLV